METLPTGTPSWTQGGNGQWGEIDLIVRSVMASYQHATMCIIIMINECVHMYNPPRHRGQWRMGRNRQDCKISYGILAVFDLSTCYNVYNHHD